MTNTVLFSFYGTTLDRSVDGDGTPLAKRWSKWRPTLSLCQHEELLPDRLEILVQPRFRAAAEGLVQDIGAASPETEVRLHEIPMEDPWDFSEVYAHLRDFAKSYSFQEEEEDYLIHITTGTHVAQICLFLLTESRHLPGRLIQTSPPAASTRRHRRQVASGTYTIIDLDLSRYDELAARFQQEHQEGTSFLKDGIATKSPTYNSLMDQIEVVASQSEAPILLTGATGVGKTRLARRIYERKQQARAGGHDLGDFLEVNCATLRGDGAMSALFGHEKGAFTGAVTRREGILQAADGGLLFLDEIGELGLDEQAMLLRAIEDGVFYPVGADRPRRSSFQLIAGTNRNLHQAVERGRFREDLLARIDLWSFCLPSLCERTEDIEPNLDYELARWEQKHGHRVVFSREARRKFLHFATSPQALWRANFRDLGAAVTRLATLAGFGRIHEEHVADEIQRLEQSWGQSHEMATSRHLDPGLEGLMSRLSDELDRFDQFQLREVLYVCQQESSMAAAGRALFAVSRQHKRSQNDSDRLRKYLARFGLEWDSIPRRSV